MFNEIKTKTREGSKVVSKDADYVVFDQNNTPKAILGATQSVGSVSVNESNKGVYEPSVQSAIDDIVVNMLLPVGGLLITTNNIDPQGESMIERLTITTTSTQLPTYIYVYGFPVKLSGTVADQSLITTDIYNKLVELKDQKMVVKDVQQISGVNNMLEVTFLDTKPHELTSYINEGVVITGELSSAPRSGFGTWAFLGENTTLVTGQTLYLWSRTS